MIREEFQKLKLGDVCKWESSHGGGRSDYCIVFSASRKVIRVYWFGGGVMSIPFGRDGKYADYRGFTKL